MCVRSKLELGLSATTDDGQNTGFELDVVYPRDEGIWVLNTLAGIQKAPPETIVAMLSETDANTLAVSFHVEVLRPSDGEQMSMDFDVRFQHEEADIGEHSDHISRRLELSAEFVLHAFSTPLLVEMLHQKLVEANDLSVATGIVPLPDLLSDAGDSAADA